MVGGAGKAGAAMNPAMANAATSEPVTGAVGSPNQEKDSKTASTDPQFGDIWKTMEAKYGAKAEKPKEIKKTLGKDDFLKIMITQMKNQDPTQPFKADQMAQQMAQYSSVEQLQNLNNGMNKLASANQPMERLAMANMIGKTITIDRERFPHTEGSKETLNYVLPKDAASAKFRIIADSGETIFEKDLGPQKAGAETFAWDGNKTNSLPAKGGNYTFQIEAKDEKGMSIQTNPRGQAKVVGVSFEGAEAVFLVGDPNKPDKITMKNVVRIDSDAAAPAAAAPARPALPGAPMGAAPGAAPAAQAAVTPASTGPNFFGFKKGEGSGGLDSEAMAQLQAAMQMQPPAAGGADPTAAKAPPAPAKATPPTQGAAASTSTKPAQTASPVTRPMPGPNA